MRAGEAPIIVGAGPVGCVFALELARHGVASTVLERSAAAPSHPKMDYLSGRSMEHFRQLGLAETIRRNGVDGRLPAYFRWVRDLRTPPLATWRHAAPMEYRDRALDDADAVAVEPYVRLRGSQLETLLRRELRLHPLIDLRTGTRVSGVEQTPATVRVTTIDEKGRIDSVMGGYLAACDGAGSTVRHSIEVGMSRQGPLVRSHSIYFSSRDEVLRRWGRAFILICGGGATIVSRDEGTQWTASLPVIDAEEDPFDRLASITGHSLQIDEVFDTTTWTGSLAVADRYRVGRVFLVGDAAHQFFPTGGHGANTGISDAIDLAWKLARFVRHCGGQRLLDSYESERRPIALLKREMSGNLLEVWQRFRRLCQIGAAPEIIAGYLRQQEFQHGNLGVHFADRYAQSPVVIADNEVIRWSWDAIARDVTPGRRAPTPTLPDRRNLFDVLNGQMTLVDATSDERGSSLMSTPAARGADLHYLRLEPPVSASWGAALAIIRPDQHVAWVGDVPDSKQWERIVRTVCGT